MADQQLTIGVDGSQANKETQKLEKNFQKLFGTIESTMRRVDRMNKKFQSMMPPTAVANLQKVNKSLQTAHARATAATKAFEKQTGTLKKLTAMWAGFTSAITKANAGMVAATKGSASFGAGLMNLNTVFSVLGASLAAFSISGIGRLLDQYKEATNRVRLVW